MACSYLSKEEHNFTCFAKACVELITLPLIDILFGLIKPIDLHNEITNSSLLTGKTRLQQGQLVICFIAPPNVPNYNKFDVTLLYTLIRNLCPSLRPTQGWGKQPKATDTQIGDDIERLREFRNTCFAHANSTAMSDIKFEALWKNLKSIVLRIQKFTKAWNHTNYEQKLTEIESCRFGYEDREKYKLFLEATLNASKQSEDIGKLIFDKIKTRKNKCNDFHLKNLIIKGFLIFILFICMLVLQTW